MEETIEMLEARLADLKQEYGEIVEELSATIERTKQLAKRRDEIDDESDALSDFLAFYYRKGVA